MLDRERRFLEVVQALLAEPVEAQLLALGDAGAALAMPDGSFATVLSLDHGTPDEIAKTWRSLIEANPAHGFKLVLVGGTAEHHALLRDLQPSMMARRVVQVFALGDDGTAWAGPRSRLDSPTGRVLAEIGARPPTDVDREALRARIVRPDPEDRARAEETRGFVETLRRGVPRVTIALLVSYAVAFGLEMLWGGAESIPTLVRMGANMPADVSREPWDLLASVWLHGGIGHLLLNGYALWMLGGFLERLLGSSRFAILYVLAALGGGIASAVAARAMLSVGASGAICGMLGAAAALAWRPAGIIPPSVLPLIRRNALVNLVLTLGISFLPQVDAMAHLGGAIVGGALVLTGVVTRGVAVDAPVRPSRWLGVGAIVCAAVLVGAFATAIVRGRPWQLAAPGAMVERSLGGVHVTVPEMLGPGTLTALGNEQKIEIGDMLRDPMAITIGISPHARLADASEQAELFSMYRRTHAWEPGPGMVPAATREDDDTGDMPAFRDRYRTENTELMLWFQVRPDHLVVVKAEWWKEHPLAGTVAAKAYASLRVD